MMRKKKINLQEVDLLKLMSIVLPILLALSGFVYMQYNSWLEPDFSDGQYYTNAWIEYGVKQNTLNVEFVPDGQGSILAAMAEALFRVHCKAELNSKIDGKPILAIFWVRYGADLIAMSQVLVTAKEVDIIEHGSAAERRAMVDKIGSKAETLYNKSQVMIERDGKIQFIAYNNITFNASRVIGMAREKPPDEVIYG